MKKLLLLLFAASSFVVGGQSISVTQLGRYVDGRESACEISAYDAPSRILFITNAASDSIDMVSVENPGAPKHIGGINVLKYGGGVNSVINLHNGFIAAAIEAKNPQEPGKVVFFRMNGDFAKEVTVGVMPDMLCATKDGRKILVANEGEPDDDYLVDPEGSVSIIPIANGIAALSQKHVKTINFRNAPEVIDGSIRKPETSFAQDLEPEYIAVNESATRAVVNCQESNVFVYIDLVNDSILAYNGLGYKDHSLYGNGFDASNKDDEININTWPVKGVYQPDGVTSYASNGQDFWLSANEGAGRDYDGYSWEYELEDLTLDLLAFPDASSLQKKKALGKLEVFTPDVIGDIDNDGDLDEIYSFGARSFSIWNNYGELVWDSGDSFERYIKNYHPAFFNCKDGLAEEWDSRSDNQGPEPEVITIGRVGEKTFAFIGLERQGGVMVFDVTDPYDPVFETYIHTLDAITGTMTDLSPEGLFFSPRSYSHNQKNMLFVSNEGSGSTTIYEISDLPSFAREAYNQSFTDFEVYPNPTKGDVNLRLDGFNTLGASFIIVNSLGAEVKRGFFTGPEHVVDIARLPKGVYVMSVHPKGDLGTLITKKIIKN